MITKAFLDQFIEGFESCKDLDFDWNNRLFEQSDEESWSQILIQRSKELRRSFETNEANIVALSNAINEPLNDEQYRLLSDAALKIYQDGYDDIRVFTLILEPCIAYFKSKGDLDILLPLLHAYCFEFEQAALDEGGYAKYQYEDILSYKDQYEKISSRYARLTLFKSYSNVISRTLNCEVKGSFMKMYELYQEALSVYQSEAGQRLDGDDEEFAYYIDRMLQTLMLYENISVLTSEEMDIYQSILKENLSDEEDGLHAMLRCTYEVLRNYHDEISNEEIVDYLLTYFDETFAHLDVHGDSNEQEDWIDDCYNIVATLSFYIDSKKEVKEKRKQIIDCMNRLRNFVKSLPYSFFNGEMNRFVYLLYQRIRPFMSLEEKKDYLLEVVMFRQPITFIHSVMVERISVAIAKTLLERYPSLFIGVLGYVDAASILSHKEEILHFIKECALFHDVGKTTLVDIINTQNRRLTDMEFDKIKTHPNNGLAVLENDPDFASYFDVIQGHHRYYDGSAGYPDNFDNTSSPIRIIIDLVTIADCTDSATDILGRNYAKGKTFLTVLDEFKLGAGTRYNPHIVHAIKENNGLINTLTSLTTDGRFEVYKEVYSRYIHEGE